MSAPGLTERRRAEIRPGAAVATRIGRSRATRLAEPPVAGWRVGEYRVPIRTAPARCRGEPGQAAADDAAVDRGAGRRRARIGVGARRPPTRSGPADGRIVGVSDEDVRDGREVGIESKPEQAAVVVAVYVGPQVRIHRRRRIAQAVEDLHLTALLDHEDAPVRREAHRGRLGQSGQDDGLLEARGERRGGRRDTEDQWDGDQREREQRETTRGQANAQTRPPHSRRHVPFPRLLLSPSPSSLWPRLRRCQTLRSRRTARTASTSDEATRPTSSSDMWG